MVKKQEGKKRGEMLKKQKATATGYEKIPPFNAVDADRIGKDIGKDRL